MKLEILQKKNLEDESQFSLDDLLAVEEKFHDSQIQYYICKRYMENAQYEESFLWAEKSAEQGSSEAAKELGNMYYFGDMVKKNYNESLKWYKIAADNGDDYSQNNLQFMFCNDEVVEYKEDSWISLCEKAAEQGQIDALLLLPEMYRYGHGVKQSYFKAIYWYKRILAQEKLDEILKKV